jgi:type II secretory pathway pseudopilin PulG
MVHQTEQLAGWSTQRRSVRAFTLVDLLVSIAVIAVLIGILTPSLSSVHETGRRVSCQSNLRQMALGVSMYADANRMLLPGSVFAADTFSSPNGPITRDVGMPAEMMSLRAASQIVSPDAAAVWDGLGLLYSQDYLAAAKVFYCPSHDGEHPFSRYVDSFRNERDVIYGNYQYRGMGANFAKRLDQIEPSRSALITDGLRTALDLNHDRGVNLARADLSIVWHADPGQELPMLLSASQNPSSPGAVATAWSSLDDFTGDQSASGPKK